MWASSVNDCNIHVNLHTHVNSKMMRVQEQVKKSDLFKVWVAQGGIQHRSNDEYTEEEGPGGVEKTVEGSVEL